MSERRSVDMAASRLFVGWFQEQRIWNSSWEDSDHIINWPEPDGRQSFPTHTVAVGGSQDDQES